MNTPEAVATVDSIEEILARLPRLELNRYRQALSEFNNPDAPAPALQVLQHPIPGPPKTAVLSPGFQQTGAIKVFGSDWTRRLERFQPEAIAAPVGVLRQLAHELVTGRAIIRPPEFAVIPFTGIQDGLVTDEDRELFWRAFRVPVFEQYLGFEGRVIAWECEAHQGLHVGEDAILESSSDNEEFLTTSLTDFRHPALRLASGFRGSIQETRCACGKPLPRLVGLRPAVARENTGVARGR